MNGFVRAIVLSAGLLLVGAASAEDVKPPADPARIAAARDLMEVTGVTKQLDGVMDAMKQGVAQGAKSENSAAGEKVSAGFDAMMEKFRAHKAGMMTDFAALYAETFTAEEMKTVADFYRSGTGAKFIALTPALMQKGAAIGMKYSEKIIKDIKPAEPE